MVEADILLFSKTMKEAKRLNFENGTVICVYEFMAFTTEWQIKSTTFYENNCQQKYTRESKDCCRTVKTV